MCLAIPGEILSLEGEGLECTGEVRFGNLQQSVALGYVPEARIGDYVIVHAGCAISVLDQQAAMESLALLDDWQGTPR